LVCNLYKDVVAILVVVYRKHILTGIT